MNIEELPPDPEKMDGYDPAPLSDLDIVARGTQPLVVHNPTPPDASMGDLMVVAKNPAEMARAQMQLVAWAGGALQRAQNELQTHQDNLQAAINGEIHSAPWRRFVTEGTRKVTYYEKILAALKEGYFIVPDFPVTMIAVRTNVKSFAKGKKVNNWDNRNLGEVKPKELPQGDGRYVGPNLSSTTWSEKQPDPKRPGETKHVDMLEFLGFQDVGMPVRLVKPVILSELGRALRSKIFDEIGILPQVKTKGVKKPDPMLVGIIRHHTGGNVKRVQFLLAWWLDTNTI